MSCSFPVQLALSNATSFAEMIGCARLVFDVAEREGHHLDVLDIGGNFDDQKTTRFTFEEVDRERLITSLCDEISCLLEACDLNLKTISDDH